MKNSEEKMVIVCESCSKNVKEKFRTTKLTHSFYSYNSSLVECEEYEIEKCAFCGSSEKLYYFDEYKIIGNPDPSTEKLADSISLQPQGGFDMFDEWCYSGYDIGYIRSSDIGNKFPYKICVSNSSRFIDFKTKKIRKSKSYTFRVCLDFGNSFERTLELVYTLRKKSFKSKRQAKIAAIQMIQNFEKRKDAYDFWKNKYLQYRIPIVKQNYDGTYQWICTYFGNSISSFLEKKIGIGTFYYLSRSHLKSKFYWTKAEICSWYSSCGFKIEDLDVLLAIEGFDSEIDKLIERLKNRKMISIKCNQNHNKTIKEFLKEQFG